MGQNEKIVGTFEVFAGILLIAITLAVTEFSALDPSLSPRIYIAFVGALMGRAVFISYNEKPDIMSGKVPIIGGFIVGAGLLVSGYFTLPDSVFRPVLSALIVSVLFHNVFSLIEADEDMIQDEKE